ncbi:ABC-F family ATP-binding cassette domain-containing protein [Paenibacillus hunanensis]|uniref:ATP-binding cassette subfamily F protein uup n=1 Tax=Paenibacillus hunanensis TaxID=539262 RepID=A0ABU1J6Z4_9BACL|nr:ABC-F family ATP-binding cassette domain-containing protein [Paenibacillus hunanensis]MDR6246712.1 ATP-binding cassette subfamily F protein uup [Paenibacillus hunanensis]GGJ32753.1 multidrug ABC transporter ATP-binding protein [Paenibacillus hunanensis]
MNIMTVESLAKSYGDKILFQDASFGMEDRDKIGIIGVNGTGKSTFLKIIAGLEEPDSGQVVIGNSVRVRYLAQNPPYDPDATVLRQVFDGGGEELQAVSSYMSVMDRLEQQPDDPAVQQELVRISQEMDRLDAWSLESEAKNVLSKLGITRYDAPMGTLSGGQRKRVALATALIQPAELLILDEPTNHIDHDSVTWLEQYLQKRRGALLMITHDRYFLDRVATVMLELDGGRLFRYEANYTRYLELKADREEREAAAEDKRQNLLRRELAWIRRGAKARTTKQKARIDRFEQLQNDAPGRRGDQLEVSTVSSRLGKQIIELEDVSLTLGGRELIHELTYHAVPGDRIGIVGPNGRGKSTLLNLISGRIEPTSGRIITGQTVKFGYFTQEHQEMDETMRVIEYIKEAAEVVKTSDGSSITAAQMLERFLFLPAAQWTPIAKLSGGEKRRLYLLRVLMGAPNVLLLDEPTNDLDITTLTVLEDYLEDFPGVVLVVSHDRYFLDRTCEKIFALEGGGVVSIHAGNYSEYEERTGGQSMKSNMSADKVAASPKNTTGNAAASSASSSATEPASDASKRSSSRDKLKFSYKEQREYEQIDSMIEATEQKLERITTEMEAAFSDSVRLQELMTEQANAEQELEHLMERWTYLNELAEKIAEQG